MNAKQNIYIWTVSSQLLFICGTLESFLAGLGTNLNVLCPNYPNEFYQATRRIANWYSFATKYAQGNKNAKSAFLFKSASLQQ